MERVKVDITELQSSTIECLINNIEHLNSDFKETVEEEGKAELEIRKMDDDEE